MSEEDAGPATSAYLAQVCKEIEAEGVVRKEASSSTGDSLVEDSFASNWSQPSSLLQAAEQCRRADFALAETGSIVLCAQGGNGRSVSLLPEVLFAVFRADQLVRRMGDVFSAMAANDRYSNNWPSSVNIITGPSRSADIENDLTIGIHGPGKVYAVIIE